MSATGSEGEQVVAVPLALASL